ncbi:MAG: DUF4332 domain-containing protein [Candidatus Thorarchaeota archaeon]
MEIDWSKVKAWTLWHYDDLISKLHKTLTFDFVLEHYDLDMKRAQTYTAALLNFGDEKNKDYLERITTILRSLEECGINSYTALLSSVKTKEQCEQFVTKNKLPFREFIRFLNHLLRWVLPFPAPLMEFISKDNETEVSYIKKLRSIGIKNNLDLLEHTRTKLSRNKVIADLVIPEPFLTTLIAKADLSRLPYIRGKTVVIFFNAGYHNLEKIGAATLTEFIQDLKDYLQSIDVTFSKSFIEPDGAIAQAKALPKFVEY